MDEEKQQKKIAYMKQYYAANKERMRQQGREWYAANRERIREYDERTREKKKERQRRWCAKKRNELKNLIQNKAIVEVIPKEIKEKKPRGRPKIHPDIVIEPKKPKTAVIERKRKLIQKNLDEIQKKVEAFKISLECINGERKSNEGGNQKGEDSGDQESE